jgi:hypothetical protein
MSDLTMTTIALLLASNVFMTLAWYGHLNYKSKPLWLVIVASWGIAFIEYCHRVLPGCARQPLGARPIQRCRTQDDPRSYHLDRICGFLRVRPQGAARLAAWRWLHTDRGRRRVRVCGASIGPGIDFRICTSRSCCRRDHGNKRRKSRCCRAGREHPRRAHRGPGLWHRRH